MAVTVLERQGRPKLNHVDSHGVVTGVPYTKTIRGEGKNGVPFRAGPGHISTAILSAAGLKLQAARADRQKTR